jgi:hypothetical protein
LEESTDVEVGWLFTVLYCLTNSTTGKWMTQEHIGISSDYTGGY